MIFEEVFESTVKSCLETYERQKARRDELRDEVYKTYLEFDPFNLKHKKERLEALIKLETRESGWTDGMSFGIDELNKLWDLYQSEKQTDGE